jgi:hypothetical protein
MLQAVLAVVLAVFAVESAKVAELPEELARS